MTNPQRKKLEIIQASALDLLRINIALTRYDQYNKAIQSPKSLEKDAGEHFIYIDTVSQKSLGYLKLMKTNLSGTCWLQSFLILPDYIGQGYGRQFFCDFFKNYIQPRNYSRIYLTCHLDNTSARQFWSSLGFHKYNDRDNIMPVYEKAAYDLYYLDL
ncbi:GNAT family N-acetyltransferase [Petrocella sp. FN5]|uniref:GNAT family N-acetyltransferase n=1 Tax=Petrocella sp. FN5 TaxID=3032002 RepID=UPI0023D9B4F3|nr:GNAT family N-acetyltransferase [Petrocella sp. FN5]MDF1618166.1 GNAT family N-acetyltransferase [Petrocella sp. FN5]